MKKDINVSGALFVQMCFVHLVTKIKKSTYQMDQKRLKENGYSNPKYDILSRKVMGYSFFIIFTPQRPDAGNQKAILSNSGSAPDLAMDGQKVM